MDSTNRKIRTCPYGFHVNNEDSECTCGTKSTDEEKKTGRHENYWNGFEQVSVGEDMVLVEDILQVARERGINL